MRIRWCKNVLIAALIFFLLPAGAQARQPSTAGSGAAGILRAMGILKEGTAGDKAVTREEFTEYAVRITGVFLEADWGGADSFDDIAKSPRRAYINTACGIGLVSPSPDKLFRGEEPVTYQQALKMLVAAAGYGAMAEQSGGYPAGYAFWASKLGIGAKTEKTNSLTLAEAADLLLGALRCDASLIQPEGTLVLNQPGARGTMMEKYLNVIEGRGIVDGNTRGGLHGPSGIPRGEPGISVNGEIFRVSDREMEELIGRSVRFFLKKDDDGQPGEILFLREDGRDTVWTLDARTGGTAEVSSDKSRVTYEENGRVREIKISPAASILYNGRYWTKAFSGEAAPGQLISANDTTVFIDNDGDGVADVIKIDELVHFLTDYSSEANRTVTDKLTGNRFYAEDTDDLYVKLKYGPEIDLSQVGEWDVLAIKAPRGGDLSGTSIYVVNDVITAVPDEVSGDRSEVVLNGEALRFSARYRSLLGATQYTPVITAGMNYRFHLGYSGEIEAVSSPAGDLETAYLVNAAAGKGLAPTVSVKVYSLESKKLQILPLADRVAFLSDNADGAEQSAVASTAQEKLSRLAPGGTVKKELIRIRKNDSGDISQILLASNRATGFNKTAVSGWMLGFTLSSRYVASGATRFLLVPSDLENENAYSIVNRAYFSNKEYTMDIYETDSFNRFGYGVLATGSGGSVDYDRPLMLVERVSQVLDSEGSIRMMISGYYDGREKSVTAQESMVSAVSSLNSRYDGTTAGSLAFGDLIQISEENGELLSFRMVYRNTPADGEILWFSNDAGSTAFIPNNELTFGKSLVTAVSQEIVTVENHGSKSLYMNNYKGFTNTYIVDLQRKKIEMGKPSDILAGEYVHTAWRWAWCMDAVVYR